MLAGVAIGCTASVPAVTTRIEISLFARLPEAARPLSPPTEPLQRGARPRSLQSASLREFDSRSHGSEVPLCRHTTCHWGKSRSCGRRAGPGRSARAGRRRRRRAEIVRACRRHPRSSCERPNQARSRPWRGGGLRRCDRRSGWRLPRAHRLRARARGRARDGRQRNAREQRDDR